MLLKALSVRFACSNLHCLHPALPQYAHYRIQLGLFFYGQLFLCLDSAILTNKGGSMEDQAASVLAEEVSQGHCHYAACDDETKRAIEELESGGGTHCDGLEELYRSLDEDD
jgi:hypothetical protein